MWDSDSKWREETGTPDLCHRSEVEEYKDSNPKCDVSMLDYSQLSVGTCVVLLLMHSRMFRLYCIDILTLLHRYHHLLQYLL